MEVLSKPDAIDDAMELRITALPLLNCTQSVTVLLLRYGARSSLEEAWRVRMEAPRKSNLKVVYSALDATYLRNTKSVMRYWDFKELESGRRWRGWFCCWATNAGLCAVTFQTRFGSEMSWRCGRRRKVRCARAHSCLPRSILPWRPKPIGTRHNASRFPVIVFC